MTPEFNPRRLSEARQARDLQQIALAELVDRTPASMSNYERGKTTPPPEVVERIAEALRVPVGYFYLPDREAAEGLTFFRSMAASSKRARDRASRRLDWTGDIVRGVEDWIHLPDVEIPSVGEDWRSLGVHQIEEAAASLRTSWGLGQGPISNVVWLLENHGIVMVRDEIGDRTLDAHGRWIDGRPIVFVSADKESAARSRFDAAHELAHLVLHRNVSPDDVRNSALLKRIERQANRFAGAFLLPAESFADEVGVVSMDALVALKPRWRVSVAAMIQRARSLRLITEERATSLFKQRSARGWTRREPYDDQILPERPRLLARAIEMIVGERLAGPDDFVAAVGLSRSDVERLAGLADGFLSGVRSQVFDIRARLKPT